MKIGADIADLKTGVDTANTKIDTFASKATSAFKALAGTAVFGAIASGIGQIVDAADEIDGFSAKINDTAENVQRLQAVAESFDTEASSLVAGIQKLQMQLGQGKLDEAITSIGLSVADFKALSPTEQFLTVAEALGKIEDPAQRAAKAAEFFGKGAAQLSGAFRDNVRDADRWIKMSGETVSVLDRLGISWGNAAASAKNFGAELLMNITQLRTLMNAYDNWIAKAKIPTAPAAPSIPGAFTPGLPKDYDQINKSLTEIAEKSIKVNKANEAAAKHLEKMKEDMREQVTYVHATERGWLVIPQAVEDTATEIADMRDSMEAMASIRVNDTWSPFIEGADSAVGKIDEVREEMSRAERWASIGDGLLGALGDAINGARGIGQAVGNAFIFAFNDAIQRGMQSQGASQGARALMSGVISAIAQAVYSNRVYMDRLADSAAGMREAFIRSMGGIAELQRKAEEAGISLDDLFRARTPTAVQFAIDTINQQLVEHNRLAQEAADLQQQIADLTQRTTVDFDKMNAVVKEFGLDISKLGPAFKQAAIDKEAQRIIDAMAIMERGGADVNGVLSGMADEIGQLVNDSIQFGTTIPENMRPWIEKLLASGELVDASGKKITDISGIKFGAPMESEMSKLTRELERLIEKFDDLMEFLRRGVPDAIKALPKDVIIDVEGRMHFSGDRNGTMPVPLAAGGIVRSPTLALVGEAGPEAVIPLSRMSSARGGGGETHIHIHGGQFDGYASEQSAARRILDALTGERERRGLSMAFGAA